MQEWEAFQDTWSAFKASNPDNLNTDWIRKGWCKPTIYKEHDVIHVMASVIDQTRAQLDELRSTAHILAAQRDDFATNLREAHVMLTNEENHHRACDEALEKRIGVAEDKLERIEAVLKEALAKPFNSDTADLIYELREALK